MGLVEHGVLDPVLHSVGGGRILLINDSFFEILPHVVLAAIDQMANVLAGYQGELRIV